MIRLNRCGCRYLICIALFVAVVNTLVGLQLLNGTEIPFSIVPYQTECNCTAAVAEAVAAVTAEAAREREEILARVAMQAQAAAESTPPEPPIPNKAAGTGKKTQRQPAAQKKKKVVLNEELLPTGLSIWEVPTISRRIADLPWSNLTAFRAAFPNDTSSSTIKRVRGTHDYGAEEQLRSFFIQHGLANLRFPGVNATQRVEWDRPPLLGLLEGELKGPVLDHVAAPKNGRLPFSIPSKLYDQWKGLVKGLLEKRPRFHLDSTVPKGSEYPTCALVASGPDMLNAKFGAEIDAHDVIFRMNCAPVNGFESHVSLRRKEHSNQSVSDAFEAQRVSGRVSWLSHHLPHNISGKYEATEKAL
uniref:beta-galactoside alpha-(2,6)-sialyltransferase n=1 Tax=Chromera velia CCMP2878 TaxID=1169474 RepID=A0A0G4FHB4_9ALVE|eukprot:Cvel_3345.t1-p1 / transcript=Cvel_3345.t1 / gene=Cvel_3345 / organism=Chromera_velia_CCMP2878 / gene_product=none, putative / transcript_product=none, putative / location=Cvel_scaffold133:59041-60274(+) / protein_length=358 / sequence_SO=supercontig / SO=protein_coding / is_pseudo=false